MNNSFYEIVKENVLAYMPEEFRRHNVRIDEVGKAGDVKLHGLSLTKGRSGTAPLLYLEPYEKLWKEGVSEKQMIECIADDYLKLLDITPELPIPDMTFESLKNHLRVKLVYDKTNMEYLKDHISASAGLGYSLVVYADMSDVLFDGAIINMRNDMLDRFGLDEHAIIEAALEGSVKNCPAKLTHIEAELFSSSTGQEPEDLLTMDRLDYAYPGVLVLSAGDRFAGAAALLYPGVMERIAELVQGSYFVLPSSVHEVLIVPDAGDQEPNDLARMVSLVNSTEVSPHEQLGNRVLFYDAEEKQMSVACDLDANRTREESR